MSGKYFLDTNVLVYAYDSGEKAKQQIAQALLTEGIQGEKAVLSSQVLSEFFTVVTSRIQTPLTLWEAEQQVDLLSLLPVVDIDLKRVKRAIIVHRECQISYWDSLIIAAAEHAGCQRILSEDLSAGQGYSDVTVENPFA